MCGSNQLNSNKVYVHMLFQRGIIIESICDII